MTLKFHSPITNVAGEVIEYAFGLLGVFLLEVFDPLGSFPDDLITNGTGKVDSSSNTRSLCAHTVHRSFFEVAVFFVMLVISNSFESPGKCTVTIFKKLKRKLVCTRSL